MYKDLPNRNAFDAMYAILVSVLLVSLIYFAFNKHVILTILCGLGVFFLRRFHPHLVTPHDKFVYWRKLPNGNVEAVTGILWGEQIRDVAALSSVVKIVRQFDKPSDIVSDHKILDVGTWYLQINTQESDELICAQKYFEFMTELEHFVREHPQNDILGDRMADTHIFEAACNSKFGPHLHIMSVTIKNFALEIDH